jgi:hypothetical protein
VPAPSDTELNEARKASRLFPMGRCSMIYDCGWSVIANGVLSMRSEEEEARPVACLRQPFNQPLQVRHNPNYGAITFCHSESSFKSFSIAWHSRVLVSNYIHMPKLKAQTFQFAFRHCAQKRARDSKDDLPLSDDCPLNETMPLPA